MKASLLGAALSLTLVGSAVAADLPLKAPAQAVPPPAPYSWKGFYVGVEGGYGWGSEAIQFTPDVNYTPAFAAGTLPRSLANDPRGGLAGIQFGTNWQFGSWVLGTASDFSWTDITRSQTTISGGGALTIIGQQKLSWLSTTRGRLGFTVTDNLLLYGTGGLADGRASASSSFSLVGCPANGNCPTGSAAKTLWGWAAGGGLEYAVGHWSFDVEYLHYDLGRLNYNMTDPTAPGAFIAASTKFSGDIVRCGINYRFDWTPWDFLFGHHS
jgi:outer membrane immunogenic protein